MAQFTGIIPAIITPFDYQGGIYECGIKNQIRYLHNNGIKTVFACGSYGAFPLMTEGERIKMMRFVTKECKDLGMKVIIHIGSTTTDSAYCLARMAEIMGADAVSSVVPFYYSKTIYDMQTFVRYFERLTKSVKIPVHVYNNPKTTGFNVTPADLRVLIKAGVRGIKDGGADLVKMMEMFNVINESGVDFDYYPSSTSMLVPGFLYGAKSCISGVCLSVPTLIMSIYEMLSIGDVKTAVDLHKKALEVRRVLGSYTGRAIAAYDVLKYKGIDVGTCREPWVRLGKSDRDYMLNQLRELEVL